MRKPTYKRAYMSLLLAALLLFQLYALPSVFAVEAPEQTETVALTAELNEGGENASLTIQILHNRFPESDTVKVQLTRPNHKELLFEGGIPAHLNSVTVPSVALDTEYLLLVSAEDEAVVNSYIGTLWVRQKGESIYIS